MLDFGKAAKLRNADFRDMLQSPLKATFRQTLQIVIRPPPLKIHAGHRRRVWRDLAIVVLPTVVGAEQWQNRVKQAPKRGDDLFAVPPACYRRPVAEQGSGAGWDLQVVVQEAPLCPERGPGQNKIADGRPGASRLGLRANSARSMDRLPKVMTGRRRQIADNPFLALWSLVDVSGTQGGPGTFGPQESHHHVAPCRRHRLW